MRRGADVAPYLGMVLLGLGCGRSLDVPAQGIIVVCLDTLRADRLGVMGHPGGLTPNLDRLASEGVVFREVYAQANETVLSHASMFTGVEPSIWGPFERDYGLPADARTIAGRLHGAGWQTGAVVAGGHMARSYGFDAGFDHYDDGLNWGSLTETGPRALQWLDDRAEGAPFFLFVHSYDTHDRYLKPTPFGYSRAEREHAGLGRELGRTAGGASQIADGAWLGTTNVLEQLAQTRPRFDRARGAAQAPGAVPLTPDDVSHLAGLYDGSVAWADAAFGLFMADLDARGRLDDTWLVVLADHGHALGSEGFFHHRFDLSDETLHVPLIIRPPGGADTADAVDGLVSLMDVGPTLLALAGRPAVPALRGETLWDGRWRAPGHAVVRSEGRLRLMSVRSSGARLVSEGIDVHAADAAQALESAEVDGETLRLVGDQRQADRLQAELVAWRRELASVPVP